MSDETLTTSVLREALALGFVRAGITGIAPPAQYDKYRHWLAEGHHGDMDYMDDDFHKRARRDMRELLPQVQSAIVVALTYDKSVPPEADDDIPRGRIAKYALGQDYHHVIRGKLTALAQVLEQKVGHSVRSRICVDSAPLLERELAARAGLGFIAKNTMMIIPGVGSYTLLGVLLTELPLAPTQQTAPIRDCGSCTACLDTCPTDAFTAPYQLDARRCISYLTIENRGDIAPDLRAKMGDWIFGCDECQDVCPYNAKAPDRHPSVPELRPSSPQRQRPSLPMLVELGSNQRKRYVDGSAMRRSNRQQLLRNVAVALNNQRSHNAIAEQTLKKLTTDRHQLVREHAQGDCCEPATAPTEDSYDVEKTTTEG